MAREFKRLWSIFHYKTFTTQKLFVFLCRIKFVGIEKLRIQKKYILLIVVPLLIWTCLLQPNLWYLKVIVFLFWPFKNIIHILKVIIRFEQNINRYLSWSKKLYLFYEIPKRLFTFLRLDITLVSYRIFSITTIQKNVRMDWSQHSNANVRQPAINFQIW